MEKVKIPMKLCRFYEQVNTASHLEKPQWSAPDRSSLCVPEPPGFRIPSPHIAALSILLNLSLIFIIFYLSSVFKYIQYFPIWGGWKGKLTALHSLATFYFPLSHYLQNFSHKVSYFLATSPLLSLQHLALITTMAAGTMADLTECLLCTGLVLRA